ncbi:cyclophilin-like fold protein [Cephaloticoccus capnophilus]|uniref:cyclophilin-like fold protein n=1 Tax=Cephaloticoccus capnophilus TaxID=1548208 RepID=UPI0012E98193|nr:cyclophilin-like fold protein [Cephaloticoccus capnophilus]
MRRCRVWDLSGLARKPNKNDAPAGSDPELGSVAYYAPWGNLSLFYKDFGYSRGLILLGSI